MQATARGDREAPRYCGDLGRREAFPLGEQENLAVPWADPEERLPHELALGLVLDRSGRRNVGCRRQPL
ncbi:MAG TPA: hypothetical protein VFG70_05235, partial [Gaiellaceae bacterium]|nr:hypothetical protein [Gaiellaceae bacterium]